MLIKIKLNEINLDENFKLAKLYVKEYAASDVSALHKSCVE